MNQYHPCSLALYWHPESDVVVVDYRHKESIGLPAADFYADPLLFLGENDQAGTIVVPQEPALYRDNWRSVDVNVSNAVLLIPLYRDVPDTVAFQSEESEWMVCDIDGGKEVLGRAIKGAFERTKCFQRLSYMMECEGVGEDGFAEVYSAGKDVIVIWYVPVVVLGEEFQSFTMWDGPWCPGAADIARVKTTLLAGFSDLAAGETANPNTWPDGHFAYSKEFMDRPRAVIGWRAKTEEMVLWACEWDNFEREQSLVSVTDVMPASCSEVAFWVAVQKCLREFRASG